MATLQMSVDEGKGYTKVRSAKQRLSFPSVISVEDNTVMDFKVVGVPSNNAFLIDFEGKRWAIGETVYTHGLMPVQITHRSRVDTEFYRVLFAAALAFGIQQSATVSVILSLPPAAYWDKDKQKDIIAGDYAVGFGGKTLTFEVPRETLQVVPEGFGTAMMFCLDQRGQLAASDWFEQEIGIVDIGTHTTDFLQFSKMTLVRRGTDSLNHALSDIHARVKTHCASQGVDLDVYQVDEVLRQGFFLKGGQRISIARERHEWSGELAQVISAHVRTLWNGGDAVENILITGGGAPYVGSLLGMEFNHVHLVEAKETGVESWAYNCEGSYRYALFTQILRQQG